MVEIFSSAKANKMYYCIYGDSGSGKSSLLIESILDWNEKCNHLHTGGPGIIYIDGGDAETPHQFLKIFASALGYKFNDHTSLAKIISTKLTGYKYDLPNTSDSESCWAFIKMHLINSALSFKQKYNRPPIIIFDNISHLPKQFIFNLQQFAHVEAAQGNIISILVNSNNVLLSNIDTTSNAIYLEIPDLDTKDAVEFLRKSGVYEPVAKELVNDITGGRFSLLTKVISYYKIAGNTNAEVFKEKLLREQSHFYSHSGLLDKSDAERAACGKTLLNAILKTGNITLEEFNKIIPQQYATYFLTLPVLSYHPISGIITFQSTAAENYARSYFLKNT